MNTKPDCGTCGEAGRQIAAEQWICNKCGGIIDANTIPENLKAVLEDAAAIVQQAEAQFKAGDRYATFSKRTIEMLKGHMAAVGIR